ncbi:hypothetical protein Q4E93_16615 [Flavitalea sp. BT771]|uniref:alpha-L-rhamnosidase-related protein n=1 Tax=Flavitalea sp. BT771 TaxID=3063329 RepID=UPI0026E31CFC|nr:hypothetical protein [Flavitalea sp. BT771]MDO6432226.1 hypothetical protein [Flavitalea sp. BT771]MDV6221136.1 hypothetical protein [Flavitalea sp. BT771]
MRTFLIFIYSLVLAGPCFAQINNDPHGKKITFGNPKLRLTLDYSKRAAITQLIANSQSIIEDPAGMYSSITTATGTLSTLHLSSEPTLNITKNTIRLSGITYGDKNLAIHENWTFHITDKDITFDIDRTLSAPVAAEKVALPVFMFRDMSTWEGAYQDYGGLAWFYLFKKMDTYGVHSSSSRFWNSTTDNGLTISVDAPGSHVAMDYSRTPEGRLAYSIGISPKEFLPRFDAGTQRRRFVRDTSYVWAPLKMNAGKTRQSITLSWFSFKDQFGRGAFKGINGDQVSAVLNTIARIGVIDKEHFGGNSWHTPYGPICLHEQYIAQMGLAINDASYLKGYQQCLDFYRDNAIKPDGRVWPRWAYSNEDAMPDQFTDKGFYEAQWGYLLDANPDFVSNVAELYDQTGDLNWVRTHQRSCERALDWILKRDANNNGLVEMMTDSQQQQRGSDWLDIVWASYENAFVNAKLYHALVLWAAIEQQLGNKERESYYSHFAEKLKTSFNKSVSEGGFWDDEKKCYIHWRDKDGSLHGNNMVTPVNFMAIAYGICDDGPRIKIILDNIETQMQKEHLFFWPVCMYSYKKGEVKDSQFPFPEYENGDLFLSWGSIAVKAYAAYRPALAVKYVKNVLAQYAKDGLAFQRYGREKQDGRGDDILSGNSLSVVGLYQAIYGINPRYNRLYLNPHITPELSGTELKYNFRGRKFTVSLDTNAYRMSSGQSRITSATDFGMYVTDTTLSYFDRSSVSASLKIKTPANNRLALDIKTWSREKISWSQTSNSTQLIYELNDIKPNTNYAISINNKAFKTVRSNAAGSLTFQNTIHSKPGKIVIVIQQDN